MLQKIYQFLPVGVVPFHLTVRLHLRTFNFLRERNKSNGRKSQFPIQPAIWGGVPHLWTSPHTGGPGKSYIESFQDMAISSFCPEDSDTVRLRTWNQQKFQTDSFKRSPCVYPSCIHPILAIFSHENPWSLGFLVPPRRHTSCNWSWSASISKVSSPKRGDTHPGPAGKIRKTPRDGLNVKIYGGYMWISYPSSYDPFNIL